jgi:hypothetical protein
MPGSLNILATTFSHKKWLKLKLIKAILSYVPFPAIFKLRYFVGFVNKIKFTSCSSLNLGN